MTGNRLDTMIGGDYGWIPKVFDEVEEKTLDIIREFIKDAPNLPVHIHKLLDIISNDKSEALDVANAASADPGMVSKILKVVNSSYYGLSRKTDNIHFAIVLLGFNEVRKIALQTGFSSVLGEGKGHGIYGTTGLWEHSYLVSICAEAIGREKDTKHAGELLTYGILHDIGKFVLYKLGMAMKKNRIAPCHPDRIESSRCLLEKEEALFDINHAIVGGMLAEKWDLSDRIRAVIQYHHHPSFHVPEAVPEDVRYDIAAVSISDAVVNLLSEENRNPRPRPEYYEILEIPADFENNIPEDVQEKIEEARQFVSTLK